MLALNDTDLTGNGHRSKTVVARDHHNADTSAAALGNSCRNLGPWRVLHNEQSNKGKAALDVIGSVIAH